MGFNPESPPALEDGAARENPNSKTGYRVIL
jgi:hypothetical protein